MTEGEEILVHISAPTTRHTDDLYRSLADAYRAFEPHRRSESDYKKNSKDKSKLSVAAALSDRDVTHDAVDLSIHNSIHNGSGESFGSFPSHIVLESQKDGLHNSQSPDVGDIVNDSFLDTSRFRQLEKIQQHWKGRKIMLSSAAEQQRPSSAAMEQHFKSQTQFIESTQSAAQGIESQLLEDTLFVAQSSNENSSSYKVICTDGNTTLEKDMSGPAPVETGPSRPSSWGSSVITGTVDEDRPAKVKKTDTSMNFTPKAFASSQDPPDAQEEHGFNEHRHVMSLSFSSLPSEVFAPAPDVSTDSPGSLPSQITEYLDAVLKQNPGRFQPSKRTRLLDTDERGYWSLVCSDWPHKAQVDFWTSFADQVRSGRLGWGITLHRLLPSIEDPEAHALGEIRIYCWGEIVEHVWLVLWLCSEGRIARSGSRWVDADDSVVMQVP